ncbi:MAG: signal recognition particle receptor subunit alpha, partial [Rickettsiales bacterium]|nr:signal recognition particle receptor subunit alpha [Rickettsiales bacterium]
MFESITRNFNGIIDKIRGRKFISEADLDSTLREVRMVLLEADVSLNVAKDFIKNVREKAVGQEIVKSVNAGQMIVKIVNDELINL